MSRSRFNVLGAIARQLRRGAPPPGASREHPGAGGLTPAGPVDGEALAARFTRELERLTGVVHRAAGDTPAIGIVLDLLQQRGVSRVLAWDDDRLGVPGLGPALRAAGVTVESCWLPATAAERTARLLEIDDVPVGLTGALAGLADTGSLALVSGPGQARIASLLPPVHIAVLQTRQLLASFADLLATHPDVCDLGSNLIVITGPSRTADIEMTLTRGVHGPGEVHVVLIEN